MDISAVIPNSIDCEVKEIICSGSAKYAFTIMGNTSFICDNCLQQLLILTGAFNRSDWE